MNFVSTSKFDITTTVRSDVKVQNMLVKQQILYLHSDDLRTPILLNQTLHRLSHEVVHYKLNMSQGSTVSKTELRRRVLIQRSSNHTAGLKAARIM